MNNVVTIDRDEFLQALESVEPGLSIAPTVDDANCFCVRKGRVTTFDGEFLCQTKLPFPPEVEFAVQGKPLLEALRNLQATSVEVWYEKKRLYVQGKRDKVYVQCTDKVRLPTSAVDGPTDWKFITPEFSEALATVAEVPATKDDQKLLRTVVHLTPRFVQATDGFSFCRYRVKTGLEHSAMIRAKAAASIASRGPSRVAESEKWLHYRTKSGLRMSVRRFDPEEHDGQKFERFDEVVKQRGDPIQFPKSLSEATKVAEVFSSEFSDDNRITVRLEPPFAYLSGEGVSGGSEHKTKAPYKGPAAAFRIGPKLFQTLIDKHSEVEVLERRLIVSAGRLFYSTSTKPPATNGKKEESHDQ